MWGIISKSLLIKINGFRLWLKNTLQSWSLLWETQKKNQFIYELIWVHVIILLRSMEGVIDDALQSHTNRIYFFFHFVSFLDKYQPWASIIIELACDHRLTNIMSTVRNQGVSQQFIHILHVQHVTRMNFKMKRCILQQFEI